MVLKRLPRTRKVLIKRHADGAEFEADLLTGEWVEATCTNCRHVQVLMSEKPCCDCGLGTGYKLWEPR